MKIGIVYAMDSEIESILSICEVYEKESYKGVNFYKVSENLILCTVGIGKVNAAYGTTLLCEKYTPDLIINAGVAGSFERFDQNTLLIASGCAQHDFDTSAVEDERFFVSTVNKKIFDTAFAGAAVALAEREGLPYRVGLIASGDRFMTDGESARQIKKLLSPLACEMEACAVAQVCLREGVKFLAIKTASDCIFAGDGQSNEYQINLSTAAKNLNEFVYKLSLKLCSEK